MCSPEAEAGGRSMHAGLAPRRMWSTYEAVCLNISTWWVLFKDPGKKLDGFLMDKSAGCRATSNEGMIMPWEAVAISRPRPDLLSVAPSESLPRR